LLPGSGSSAPNRTDSCNQRGPPVRPPRVAAAPGQWRAPRSGAGKYAHPARRSRCTGTSASSGLARCEGCGRSTRTPGRIARDRPRASAVSRFGAPARLRISRFDARCARQVGSQRRAARARRREAAPTCLHDESAGPSRSGCIRPSRGLAIAESPRRVTSEARLERGGRRVGRQRLEPGAHRRSGEIGGLGDAPGSGDASRMPSVGAGSQAQGAGHDEFSARDRRPRLRGGQCSTSGPMPSRRLGQRPRCCPRGTRRPRLPSSAHLPRLRFEQHLRQARRIIPRGAAGMLLTRGCNVSPPAEPGSAEFAPVRRSGSARASSSEPGGPDLRDPQLGFLAR